MLGLATALGARRVRRRPDQDPALAQPGPEQDRQDRRPAGRRGAVRRAGAAVPQRRRADARQRRTVLRPRDRHRDAGAGGVRAVLRGPRQRLVQRGELHRRAGRAGGRRDGDGHRGLRADHVLAVPQRVRDQPGTGLLQRARPAGPGAGRRGHRGRLHRVPVVERRARQDLHGRHRVAGARRHHRGSVGDQPHRDARRRARGAVRGRGHLGGRADPGVPHHRPPGVPDGAVPPSLRAGRMGRDHGDHPVLAADGDRVRSRGGAVLQRVAGRRRGLPWRQPAACISRHAPDVPVVTGCDGGGFWGARDK